MPEILSRLRRTYLEFFATNGGFEGTEISTPSNPETGNRYLYPKTDGWYDLDDNGVETKLSRSGEFLFYTIDNNGTQITTGSKLWTIFPYAGTIKEWRISADQTGSIAIDIWKAAWGTMPTSGNKISSTTGPSLSNAQFASSVTLTDWTITMAEADVVVFNVASCSTITRVVITLKITLP